MRSSEHHTGGRGALIIVATSFLMSLILNFTLPATQSARQGLNVTVVPTWVYQLSQYLQFLASSAIVPFLAVWWWLSYVTLPRKPLDQTHPDMGRAPVKRTYLRRGSSGALVVGATCLAISLTLHFALPALQIGRPVGSIDDVIPVWVFSMLHWLQLVTQAAVAPAFATWWGLSHMTPIPPRND